jgi:hypothetical protein
MKAIKKICIILCCVIILLVLAAGILFFNEIRTLASLKKIDIYSMYQMTYYGDYGFDEFLKTGASSDKDIEKFVTRRLLKGLPIDLGVTGGGCTAFVTHNDSGDVIFARNFDFSYTPSMQLITHPDNGYASVSTVNLTFAGYSADKLPDGLSFKSFLTLAAPYLPFDGMNEKGVVIALLAVPKAEPPHYDSKVTLNTTTAIRLVLDKAANVDEAVTLLQDYNIYFSGDIECHYLIADASGKSVIVEYWDGKLQTVEPTEGYQIVSNFIAYDGLNIGEGFTEFERYDKVKETLDLNGGVISEDAAVELLKEVGVTNNGVDKLQWSVIYNLTTLKGKIFAHRNTGNIIDFKLE